MPRSRRTGAVIAAALVLAVACVVAVVGIVAARSGDPPTVSPAVNQATSTPPPAPTESPSPSATPAQKWTVLSARPAVVRVHDAPRGREIDKLTNPNRYGKPLVFLAVANVPGWWQVELPVRPNGSRGWVRAVDVRATHTSYEVHVYLGAHRLDVHDGDRLAMRVPIAVGTSDSPTPGGHYYLTMLFKVDNAEGPYGPWAFGISGFSDVYTTFANGNGEIGIHGTNEPWLVGGDVSHGCIRLRNEDITRLAAMVPVGAPAVIHP